MNMGQRCWMSSPRRFMVPHDRPGLVPRQHLPQDPPALRWQLKSRAPVRLPAPSVVQLVVPTPVRVSPATVATAFGPVPTAALAYTESGLLIVDPAVGTGDEARVGSNESVH